MALYYDRVNERYSTSDLASSELILDKIQTFSNHSFHNQEVKIDGAPVKYIKFNTKNGWKIDGTYQYDDILYIEVFILHKTGTYLSQYLV